MPVVSIYSKITHTKDGERAEFNEIFEAMRAGYWKDKITPLRELVQSGAPAKEINDYKNGLPYFTASGAFTTRNENGLIKHSGKLCVDFDKVKDHEAVRNILNNDKYSEYVFMSCSGRGYGVIVNIDPTKHLQSFLFLEKYYMSVYGLEMDPACKDISRPRIISYDPNLFRNPEYETVVVPETWTSGATTTVDSDDEKYSWVLEQHNKKQAFVEGNRHNYLVILAFFCNKCGISESYTYNRYMSDYSFDGNEKELTRIVRDCYKNVGDFATFTINKKISELPPEFTASTKKVYAFAHRMNEAGRLYTDTDVRHLCESEFLSESIVRSIFKNVFEKNQDSFGLDEKPELAKVELFIKRKYDIKRNEITHRLECRDRATNAKMDKLNTDSISRDLMHAQFKFPLDKLKSLLRSDYIETYNPIQQYFDALPHWLEGEEDDYITRLADHVKTDNQDFWKVQFKKALVRCIACTLAYIENRIIVTLVGESQETGKSSFIRFLCPPQIKDYYTETAMDSGKDSDIQLSENMFWNLEELAALHNNEINKLKATISKSNVKQRRAYAEFHDSNPRRVNFWASTNKTEFLTDDQNTRWLCFNVLSIDHNYNNIKTGVKNVNINNVWAQAYTLYKSGFDYNLTKEEAAQRDQLNKEYELSSTERELILTHFKPDIIGSGKFYTHTDILIMLQNATDNKIKLNPHAISKAMKQLDFVQGFKKTHGKTQRGYFMFTVSTLDVTPDETEDYVETQFNRPEKPF